MSSFKFEVIWTLNGVDYDLTNLYTFYMCLYEGFGLEAPPVQIPHMGPYKMCIRTFVRYLFHLMSNLLQI